MALTINPRLATLGDYPFTRLAALLEGLTPRVNRAPLLLSVGEPQHAPPPQIAAILAEQAGTWGKYPPTAGTPAFRQAVAGWLGRRFALPEGLIEPDRCILPLSGTREGLYLIAQLAVPELKDGRRPAVLMPNPFYAVYEGAARMAGAEPVFLPATGATGFLPDLEALTPELLARTALFYLCSPANPQGAAASAAYLARALELARAYDFVLVLDECYTELWYREPPAGGLAVAAAVHDPLKAAGHPLSHLLTCHSLSKRSNAAGLRSGFIAGDPALIAAFARLRSYANAGMPLPVLAAAAALWADDAHAAETRARYQAKMDAVEPLLAGRFGFYRPDGGFFLWLDVGDGEQATRTLWAEAGLKVLPGAFLTRPDADGDNHGRRYIRVALVHEPDVLAEAAAAMVRLLG